MNFNQQHIIDFINRAELLSAEHLQAAKDFANEKGIDLLEALVATGALSQKQVQKIVSYLHNIPFVNLSKKNLEMEHLSRIPEPIAREHAVVCFQSYEGGEVLHIACRSVDDLEAVKSLPRFSNTDIVPHFAHEEDIFSALRSYQKKTRMGVGVDLESALGSMRTFESIGGKLENLPATYLEEFEKDYSPIRFLKTVVSAAQDAGARQIIFNPQVEHTLVSYRVEGRVYKKLRIPVEKWASLLVRLKLMSDYPVTENKKSFSGPSFFEKDGDDLPMISSFYQTTHGQKVVLTLVTKKSRYSLLEELFGTESAERLYETINAKKGMLYLAGRSQSGLTKTKYSLLSLLISEGKDIVSFEHVIENDIPGVTQVVVDQGLRSSAVNKKLVEQVLSTNPDVAAFEKTINTREFPLELQRHSRLTMVETNSLLSEVKHIISESYVHQSTAPEVGVIMHDSFKKLDQENRTKYFLSDKEVALLRKFLSPTEVKQAIFGNSYAADGAKGVHFYKASKKSVKKKIKDVLGTNSVFVRSYVDLDKFITLQSSKKNNATLGPDLRFLERQAMLQAALPKAYAGSIDIKDVLKRLNS